MCSFSFCLLLAAGGVWFCRLCGLACCDALLVWGLCRGGSVVSAESGAFEETVMGSSIVTSPPCCCPVDVGWVTGTGSEAVL